MNLWAHSEVINVFTERPTPNQNETKHLCTKVSTWVELDGAVQDSIHDFYMYLKPWILHISMCGRNSVGKMKQKKVQIYMKVMFELGMLSTISIQLHLGVSQLGD